MSTVIPMNAVGIGHRKCLPLSVLKWHYARVVQTLCAYIIHSWRQRTDPSDLSRGGYITAEERQTSFYRLAVNMFSTC